MICIWVFVQRIILIEEPSAVQPTAQPSPDNCIQSYPTC